MTRTKPTHSHTPRLLCACGIPGTYKCPRCRTPYCSVACCRRHKDNCSPVSPRTSSNIQSKYLPSSALRDPHSLLHHNPTDPSAPSDEPPWPLTDVMKHSLHNSTWLHDELSDPGLQQLLASIDVADENTQHNGLACYEKGRRTKDCEWTPREVLLEWSQESNPPLKRFLEELLVIATVAVRTPEHGDTQSRLIPMGRKKKRERDIQEILECEEKDSDSDGFVSEDNRSTA